MEREKQEAVLEAALFTMGDSVEIGRLAELIEEDKEVTRAILYEMRDKMSESCRGITLVELDNAFQMCSKTEMYEYLIQLTKNRAQYTLSDSALETLSIIAYKQPVTKAEIERVRGVNCDHAVNRLVAFDLVKELGRLDAPGRPLLFGTTEEFLRRFGVRSLEELPRISTVQMEEFKEQAQQEAGIQIPV
ncbi:MAG: SMC-Scp complex subunit ScpB [Lachnospiraceae bacterium]|nr:SMC-Scp complex subunit ScpB [Lachnospiraceae bacterium]